MPAVPTDPDALMAASKCYKCIPAGTQPEVIIYLLNQILGTGLTPDQLMANAKCYKCIPAGMQLEVQTYLLDQLAS
jgi:hypothetical protein